MALLWALLMGLAALRPLSVPDEGRYGEIGRWMLQSGDWLTPRVNGIPFFHKPPYIYWLEAMSLATWGVHAWALRLAGSVRCLKVPNLTGPPGPCCRCPMPWCAPPLYRAIGWCCAKAATSIRSCMGRGACTTRVTAGTCCVRRPRRSRRRKAQKRLSTKVCPAANNIAAIRANSDGRARAPERHEYGFVAGEPGQCRDCEARQAVTHGGAGIGEA